MRRLAIVLGLLVAFVSGSGAKSAEFNNATIRSYRHLAQLGQIPGWPPIQPVTAWTPAQLPGLIAWYKADVGVFTDTGCTTPATNSTTVACWQDQSGHGYNCLQATSGNRPTFLTAGLNSKQTVSFTGASFQGCITATGVAFGTGNTASGFLIGTFINGGGVPTNFGNGVGYCAPAAACNVSGSFLAAFRNGSGVQGIAAEKGATSTGTQSITYATETRFGGVADGSLITSYVNNVGGTGVSVTNASINSGCIVVGNASTACVFLGSSGQDAWNGVISEVVITNSAMSSGDRALLDAYLVARW